MTTTKNEQHDEELAGYGAVEEEAAGDTPPQAQPIRPGHDGKDVTPQGAEPKRGPLPDGERD